ncbi:MAG: hypothetical protein AB3N16_07780 [Flavobacteriaceae bacterium]
MKYLKYALIFFFVVDILIFLISQINPEFLVTLLPQFDLESVDNAYPRLVGVLFLALGLARLYGGLYINEKGAFIVSMWSWVVELVYTLSELFRSQFVVGENIAGLVMAPLMLIWSLMYFTKNFRETQ